MTLEHLGRAACERPQTNRTIPGCRGECGAIRRYRKRNNRPLMPFKNTVGVLFPRRPESDAGVLAGGCGPPVGEHRDGIHRALMKPQHLLGGVVPKRPAYRRGIEAARERGGTVGGD